MKNNWQTKKLGEISSKITDGSHFSPKNTAAGSYPYITVRDVIDDKIDFDNCKFIDEESYKNLLKNGCQPLQGDILFSKDGTVGKVSLVDYKKDFVVLSSLAIIRPNQLILNPKYLKYALQSPTFLKTAIGNKTGVAIKRIILKNLAQIDISYPESFSEQKRIVNILDEVFENIEKAKKNTEKNLQNSRDLFESIREKVFNEISREGDVTYLPNIVRNDRHSIKRGPFGSSITKSMFVDSGYKIYEQKNAIRNDFTLGRYYINQTKFNELEAFKIIEGDIIISCSGTIGKIAIAPSGIEEGIINQALLKISLDSKKMVNRYFIHFFENLVSTGGMSGRIKGTAIKNITSVKELKRIPIPVPESTKDQMGIVKKLDDLSEQTKKLEEIYKQKLADLEELKNSILQKAFAGEL